MLHVSGSMSTNTGVAPRWRMDSAVAMKVYGVVTTSSPGPTPAASSARDRAVVPLLQPTAWATPCSEAKAVSKARAWGPWT